ncbi:nitroreductase family protein [Rhizosaccharibacter radicis]|uniref:Putative NAD(P)H nitroreductase n=1 Tax=Rhizosaccharibacter radicis TaxID=2782605 RepID=A0ABT1W1G9_9PROT|nr:nitroreductase [Acetobacteraceae bacterium KSS12]
MSPTQFLLDRSSTNDLREPAPEGEVLRRILEAGLRAPDHGRLLPWRYVLIRGEAREKLADLFEAATLARDPEAPAAFIEKQRNKALRPPLLVAVGARIRPDHKIPELEQLLTVGAGAMNVLNAIHAEGFGAIWITGANGYDPLVAEALGFREPDRLLGFLFVGTPRLADRPAPRRPTVEDHAAEWTGEPVRWRDAG